VTQVQSQYCVEIRGQPQGNPITTVLKLAQTFNMGQTQAQGLLEKLNNGKTVRTRPTERHEAERWLEQLRQFGFECRLYDLEGKQTLPENRPVSSVQKPLQMSEVLTQEPDAAPTTLASSSEFRKARQVSLRTKFLFASIIPTVLAISTAIAAILLTVPNALKNQVLVATHNPAVTLAAGIEGLVPSISTQHATGLQASLERARPDLQREGVTFVAITDAVGNSLAGWYGTQANLNAAPSEIRTYIATQGRRAIAQDFMRSKSYPSPAITPSSRLVDAAGTPLEVASRAIERDNAPIGTVVIGMTSQAVRDRVTGTVTNTLLSSVLPVVLAVALAFWLAGSITRNVIALVRSADRISMGELEAPVTVQTNDELSDLAQALERMRVSLHESLIRLRRQRQAKEQT
jgi:HAMP domain-containing protein